MEEEAHESEVPPADSEDRTRCIAFAESLKEWAELPVEGPDATAWAAALAHEMTEGFWRGCNVRVVSPENRLYRIMIEDRISASLWRNRTADLGVRAHQLAKTMAPAEGQSIDPDVAELAAAPVVTLPEPPS